MKLTYKVEPKNIKLTVAIKNAGFQNEKLAENEVQTKGIVLSDILKRNGMEIERTSKDKGYMENKTFFASCTLYFKIAPNDEAIINEIKKRIEHWLK